MSENTVKKYREELEAMSQIATLDVLIRKDGKSYPRHIEQRRFSGVARLIGATIDTPKNSAQSVSAVS